MHMLSEFPIPGNFVIFLYSRRKKSLICFHSPPPSQIKTIFFGTKPIQILSSLKHPIIFKNLTQSELLSNLILEIPALLNSIAGYHKRDGLTEYYFL